MALVAIAFAVQVRSWSFLSDDAFIAFRYAQNWARLGSPTFNPGELPPIEGYTSFAWVAWLAAVARIGWAPHDAAPVSTALATAAALVGVVGLGRAVRIRFGPAPSDRLAALDLVPACLAVALPEVMVWSGGGLETNLLLAAMVATAWAAMSRQWLTASVLAALAVLTRPDAVVPLSGFAVAWAVVGASTPARLENARRLRVRWLALLAFVLPVLTHLIWRRVYYGTWLPNTWAIKSHGHLLRDTWGRDYVFAWLQGTNLPWALPLAVFVRPRHLVLLVPLASVVAWAWWVGGDFMAYGRFLVVATALACVLVAWLLAEAGHALGQRWTLAPQGAAAVGLIFACALGWQARQRWLIDRESAPGWIAGRWEGVTTMAEFARVRRIAGEWMAEHLPAQTTLVVGAAGALPYSSGLPAHDAFGLVAPALVSGVSPRRGRGARPGHQLSAPIAAVSALDADLWCHVGYYGAAPPSRRRIVPSLRKSHVWACVPPHADIGYYCCLRPRDRVVGPFS